MLQIGIINLNQTQNNFCSNAAFFDPFNCNNYLSTDLILERLQAAQGKKTFHLGGFDKNEFRKDTPLNPETERECFSTGTMVFVQMACVISDEEVATRMQ